MDITALKEIITPDALEEMTPEQLQEFYEVIKPFRDYERYNRLEVFEPYAYQRKFMDAGFKHKTRYLRAGNRTGKTYGAGAEFSYHITGKYPWWWQGAIIPGGGHTFWALGITQESAAKVIQKELFGTADCRIKELIGTGSIPRDNIVLDRGFVPDGPKIKQCLIRHESGNLNTMMFYGCENPETLHGQKCALIWIDEEAFNAMEIYSICRARLTNALGQGNSGYMMITATPERGYTPLNKLFDNDESGVLFLLPASWDDCPNFTPEQIEQELAQYPKWQHEMRRRGVPVIGTGAVFDVDDSQIKLMAIAPGAHWETLAAIDWGENLDPTVIAVGCKNPDNSHFYITDIHYLNGDTYSRSPANVARILKENYPGITVIRPHDHPALSQQLREFGINVMVEPFRNPPQSMLRAHKKTSVENTNARDIEVGLDEMRLLFSEGRLKVLAHCSKWFEEKASYFYTQNKNSGKVDRSKPDHAMDASRYLVLSLMGNRGGLYADAFNPYNAEYEKIENLPFTL